MLSSCKPVQLSFVNMQIERYGKKGLHMLCTAILGNLKYFLFVADSSHYDGKYMQEIIKTISYKSLEPAFIALFSEITMTLTIGGWGNGHPKIFLSIIPEA